MDQGHAQITNDIVKTGGTGGIGGIVQKIYHCHYCDYSHYNEKEVERHSFISHPSKPARPDPDLLKLIKQNKGTKEEDEKFSSKSTSNTNNNNDSHKGNKGDSKITAENELEDTPTQNTVDLEELKSLISSSLYNDVLSILEKEKNPQIRELIIYNSKNISKRSLNSDTYVCSVPKCYSGDKWDMLKHPCKNFYKRRK